MNSHRMLLATAALAASLGGLSGVAVAQEITAGQLEAAGRVAASAPTIGDFTNLLPVISEQVQNQLIRRRPDLFREISAVVEEEALAMATRRAELDSEVARIWARRFTEEELNRIDDFFASELGTKYKSVLPQIGEEILRSGRSWASRMGDELLERSTEELKRRGHTL